MSAVPDEDVMPGLLTPRIAAALSLGMGQAESDRLTLAKYLDQYPDELPAKLTGYDSATGSYRWKRRTYDQNGQRRDHDDTVERGPTWCPAFSCGNGVNPPASFPVDVWLRRRSVAVNASSVQLGAVYEFDWVCACASLYSGSGGTTAGSGGAVGRPCCPNGLPTTGQATIGVNPSCTTYSGQVIPIAYSGIFDWWEGTKTVSGTLIDVVLYCTYTGDVGGYKLLGYMAMGTAGSMQQCVSTSDGTFSCGPPFQMQFAATCPNSACPTISLTVTFSP